MAEFVLPCSGLVAEFPASEHLPSPVVRLRVFMAIAICSYCGGLVLVRATMCPHCGQRGEATPSRRKVSTFGSKKGLPLVARRLIVCAIVGTGAVFCLALANWMRPTSRHPIEDAVSECDSIRESGEEAAGELNKCEAHLARLRAALR